MCVFLHQVLPVSGIVVSKVLGDSHSVDAWLGLGQIWLHVLGQSFTGSLLALCLILGFAVIWLLHKLWLRLNVLNWGYGLL